MVTTVTFRRADQRPFPRRAEFGSAHGARRATEADPDSVFLPLDIVILLFGILSNHCPKKSWGGDRLKVTERQLEHEAPQCYAVETLGVLGRAGERQRMRFYPRQHLVDLADFPRSVCSLAAGHQRIGLIEDQKRFFRQASRVVARGLEGNPEGDVAGIFPIAGTRDGRREVGTQREAALAPGRAQVQQGPVVLASRHVSIVRIAAAHSLVLSLPKSYLHQNPVHHQLALGLLSSHPGIRIRTRRVGRWRNGQMVL